MLRREHTVIASLEEVGPPRVVFGPGSLARVPDELHRLTCARAYLVSGASQHHAAAKLATALGDRCVGWQERAIQHVPADLVAEVDARTRLARADVVIAIGGGSAIGLAKCLALALPIEIVAVPTTYSGSEMTEIYGITAGGEKRTGRDPRARPGTVIYDPALLQDLPARLVATSGLNALAHAVEGLYAPDTDTDVEAMAAEGIKLLAESLPEAASDKLDLDARARCLQGAWRSGAVLGRVRMGLHHKLCHTLGGSFALPHSDVHAVMLPYTAAYNYRAARRAMEIVERAMDAPHAPSALQALATRIGAPRSLAEIGMRADLLDAAAERVLQDGQSAGYVNPRPLDPHAIRALLEHAFQGLPAIVDTDG
jgi:maleylacetate reductase